MDELSQTKNLKAFDRLAALLADVFLIFPLILLATSNIREKLNEYITVGLTSKIAFGQILVIFVGLGLLCFYRSFFQVFTKRSIGQKLLKIRVKDSENHSSKWTLFMRLFVWNFTGLLFPFSLLNLSTFYTHNAKSVFDSLFGFNLVSVAGASKVFHGKRAGEFNKLYLKRSFEFVAFFHIALFLLVVSYLTLSFKNRSIDFSSIDASSISYPVCEEVDVYHKNWKEDELTASRIETSLALFGIGKISEDCLGIEANLALRANPNNEMGYLAAYLVAQSSETSQVSFLKDLYLKRVCEEAPESSSCAFSKSLTEGRAIKESPLLISNIWGVKRDLVFGRFKGAKRRLESLPKAYGFDLFITQMNVKLKSLLSSDTYSELDMGIALSSMDNSNQLEFSRWICYEDLKGKCGKGLTSACSHFVKRAEVKKEQELDLEDNYLLGKIKTCNKEYTGLSKKGVSTTVLKYAGNQKLVEEIIFSSKMPEFIKLDAIHRLLEITTSKEDVKGLASEWARQSERDFRWRKLGELLASKLGSMEEEDLAAKVFYGLVKEYGKNEFLIELDQRIPASTTGN